MRISRFIPSVFAIAIAMCTGGSRLSVRDISGLVAITSDPVSAINDSTAEMPKSAEKSASFVDPASTVSRPAAASHRADDGANRGAEHATADRLFGSVTLLAPLDLQHAIVHAHLLDPALEVCRAAVPQADAIEVQRKAVPIR